MVVVILDSTKIYRRGGMADRWMGSLVDHFTDNVRWYAPVRSGELEAGIWGEHHTVGPHEIEGVIHSDAPHSMYVIDGTTGPIMSAARWASGGADAYEIREVEGMQRHVGKPGFWLKLRADEGGPESFQTEVSGQESNNFMLAGWVATGRQHSSVRGVTPILFR